MCSLSIWLHEGEVGRRHRARQVVHRAARDADGLGLLGDAQRMITVDHRLALSNPALLSAPSKKSFSKVSSPILACRAFTSTARRCRRRAAARPEHVRRAAFELRLPARDLVRVDVELLRHLRNRPLTLDRRQRHLGLEGRRVVPPSVFCSSSLLIRRHNRARCQADIPLIVPSEIVEPLLPLAAAEIRSFDPM